MGYSGLSQRHVANVLGVSQSVVSRMWNRFITTGNVRHLHAGGRERSTNEVQDRFLVVQARHHRFDKATTLRRDFQIATSVRISIQTIRNRLHDAGLRSRRPAIRVPLTRYHVQMRLAWARDHVTWTQNDWAPVLYTDESRFCVDFTDRRARVWRMPNERFAPVCVAEHDRFCGGLSHGLSGNKCSEENGPPRHWQRHVDGSQVRKRDLGCLRSPICRCCWWKFHSDGWQCACT